jgi:curved DNA-binding protein CbpA
MTAMTLDPYAALGIPAGASRDDAARAHRRLAKQFHPDINPGLAAAERMRRINEAWRILSNPVRRLRYEAERGTTAWPGPGYASRPNAGTWAGAGYGPRQTTATWTTWPESRRAASPRMRRPPGPASIEPSFGDRRDVLIAVWIALPLLGFIGTWLGSLAP